MNLKEYIADVVDFPKKGIIFRDITPLMANGPAYKYATKQLSEFSKSKSPDVIIGPEARGFIFGCPVAIELGLGFIPIRKPGKLPRKTTNEKYDLEYGSNELAVHANDIPKGSRVVIIDDLLATGGTIEATIKLIEKQGGIVVGIVFLIELEYLNGRELLKEYDVLSLIKY